MFQTMEWPGFEELRRASIRRIQDKVLSVTTQSPAWCSSEYFREHFAGKFIPVLEDRDGVKVAFLAPKYAKLSPEDVVDMDIKDMPTHSDYGLNGPVRFAKIAWEVPDVTADGFEIDTVMPTMAGDILFKL